MSWTLSSYIARRYLSALLVSVFVVLLIIVLVDLVERLRGADASFGMLLWLSVLRAPTLAFKALPFAVLLASMITYARLARSSELTVARAAGLSAWRLLAPSMVVAALVGVFAFSAYNPVASAMADRYDVLTARIGGDVNRLSVSPEGIWLRQGGRDSQIVIHADSANATATELFHVTFYEFANGETLVRRIDADSAELTRGAWLLSGVDFWDLTLDETIARVRLPFHQVPTSITPEEVIEGVASPETISFWKLPAFIQSLERSGFSARRHRIHWHAQLASPLLFAAMMLIGAAFSMRPARFGGLGVMALGCVITGLGYYFIADLSLAFGFSGGAPILAAAWAPPVSALFLAVGLLLHLEDG